MEHTTTPQNETTGQSPIESTPAVQEAQAAEWAEPPPPREELIEIVNEDDSKSPRPPKPTLH